VLCCVTLCYYSGQQGKRKGKGKGKGTGKVKGKVRPRTGHEDPKGEKKYSLLFP
jgi:hypothetical protein